MKLALRSIHSADVDHLDLWTPSNDFGVDVRLTVGPQGGPGEESFDLTVCTGGWLAAQAREHGCIEGTHHLVVDHYDWSVIRTYIASRVDRCEGATWREAAEQLAKFAHWEFEDYKH
jgi:hypothetical protein